MVSKQAVRPSSAPIDSPPTSPRHPSSQAAQQAAVAALGLRALAGDFSDELFDDALSSVCETLQVDFAEILQVMDRRDTLLLRAGVGWAPGSVGRIEVGAGPDTLAGYTLLVRDPVVVRDLRESSPYMGSSFLLAHDVVSGVNVIIHGNRGPFGVLGVHTRERRAFSVDEVNFLQGIAKVLAAAIKRHHHEVEREELLAEMRLAVAGRDRAVSIVAHDLGNPLSTIQICVNALLDREPPPVAGVRHMARIIQRSTAWMQQIVQDLLDHTSLNAGLLVLERHPTPVSDLIGAAQVMFVPVAREQELEFVVETDCHLPRIYADPRRLLQVLSNLLGNAMKFTPPGGRVVLSARPGEEETGAVLTTGGPGNAICFQVADTGPGIAPEDLLHVFEWFWHSSESRRSGTGLGLGLAIAGGLVQAHGGRIHVRSYPGEGSTFWFTVPTVKEVA